MEKLRPGSRLRRQTRRGGACLRGADPPRVAEVALPFHGRRAGARRCDARGLLPFDAALACEDNTLKATIPATQSGSITPCLVGKATARANSYEGYDIELKQLFCTMYVSVKKGNYSISKAVVKANGGETIAGDISIGIDDGSVNASAQTITVTPPSPIDCTGEARLIPVMIAPVTLSQGMP
ncbi:MAG: hypothetical protein ACLU9X_10025 [Alistipes shahii]